MNLEDLVPLISNGDIVKYEAIHHTIFLQVLDCANVNRVVAKVLYDESNKHYLGWSIAVPLSRLEKLTDAQIAELTVKLL